LIALGLFVIRRRRAPGGNRGRPSSRRLLARKPRSGTLSAPTPTGSTRPAAYLLPPPVTDTDQPAAAERAGVLDAEATRAAPAESAPANRPDLPEPTKTGAITLEWIQLPDSAPPPEK
jgi:hypothetical protein